MVLAHNLTAMNAQRQFNIVGTSKKKSTEKLSSGYIINRAADDAAGLTISEKMRSQIRGLRQASDNCQDGVSLCQVADGALTETHDILQRMHELSIKSANGTNTDADREAIQKEVEQPTQEFDRIANSTSFNEKIYPLNQGISADQIKKSGNGDKWLLPACIVESEVQTNITAGIKYSGIEGNGTDVTMKGINLIGSIYDGYRIVLNGGWTESHGYGWHAAAEGASDLFIKDLEVDDEGFIYYKSVSQQYSGRKMYLINEKIYDMPGNLPTQSYIEATTSNSSSEEIEEVHLGGYDYRSQSIYLKAVKLNDTDNPENEKKAGYNTSVIIQAGAQNREEQRIPIHFVDATKKGLKLTDPEIDVSTEDGAKSAIERVKNAIDIVSGYRSYFGATQNRLEHAIANLDNVVENTQAADSRIRDTDIATEMVNNTKLNIHEQAVTSMMAQANQSTQGVLSLLQ